MLKDCGGFQLLRSRGSTRSKKLDTIPCPDDGYSPEYLLSESVMVGQALIYIRPLQKDIDLQTLESDQPISSGPLTECLYCNKKYSLSEIQDHVDVCENARVQVRPEQHVLLFKLNSFKPCQFKHLSAR
ncbi:hypothetical protein IRJ41_011554 [Triplophysa rosa]|uniref:Uncharacterized protein n=1 Tax=Triplophysa rosa TaxID=992332 RepID=A0A9W7WH85_TRIRA|nr:hypothetical protein IRJ41_011554 [Triplophysa rosa]